MSPETIIGALIVAIVTSLGTGFVSSQLTVAALKVHIEYLKSHIDRHENAINRAHARIDEVERKTA